MKEYVVNKGRGTEWVELYRSWDKDDAQEYMMKSAQRLHDRVCDRYTETAVSRIMIWDTDIGTSWYELVEEQS